MRSNSVHCVCDINRANGDDSFEMITMQAATRDLLVPYADKVFPCVTRAIIPLRHTPQRHTHRGTLTSTHRLEATCPEKRDVKIMKTTAKANSCITGLRATRRGPSPERRRPELVCSGPKQEQGKPRESPSTG